MAIDFKKAKPTRHPGVLRFPDGRLLVRAALRLPDFKVVSQRKVLPEAASELDAVQAVLDLKDALKNPQTLQTPTPLPPDTSQTFEAYATQWLKVRSAAEAFGGQDLRDGAG